MDATLHLPTVTQPESTDADEVDARNRRLGLPHLPLLICPAILAQRRETASKSLGKSSQMVSETVVGLIPFPYLLQYINLNNQFCFCLV